MYYNGRKDILEADSFVSLHELELERVGDGQYVRVLLKLDPANHFADGEKPLLFVLSNGVQTRILGVEPMPAEVPAPAAVEEAPVAQEPAPAPAPAVADAPAPSPAEPAPVAADETHPEPTEAPEPVAAAPATPAAEAEAPAAEPAPEAPAGEW